MLFCTAVLPFLPRSALTAKYRRQGAYLRKLLPTHILMSAAIICYNYAYVYLPVPFIQISKVSFPMMQYSQVDGILSHRCHFSALFTGKITRSKRCHKLSYGGHRDIGFLSCESIPASWCCLVDFGD